MLRTAKLLAILKMALSSGFDDTISDNAAD